MEERSKEEILSELYAIRAAMSLVSQKMMSQINTKMQMSVRGAELRIVCNASAMPQKHKSSKAVST